MAKSTSLSDTALRDLAFMESRIPALPALEGFVPAGTKPSQAVQAALDRAGSSRWFPVEGGHRVVILYEGGWAFESTELNMRAGAWDHEHCSRCGEQIPAMTLCWVTESGDFLLLCSTCHSIISASVS
jgi:hypothetical protein